MTASVRSPYSSFNSGSFSIDENLARQLRHVSLVVAIVTFVVSAAGIIGWVFGIDELKRPLQIQPAPQSATFVSFFLVSLALLFIPLRRKTVVSTGMFLLGAVVLTTGFLNLIEHTLRIDLGLAFPLLQLTDAKPLTFPGHIAPDVAASFIVLGAVLFLEPYSSKCKIATASQILMTATALPNLLILLGFAAGTPHMCAYFGCVRISLLTSVLFFLSAIALLCSKPHRGVTRFFAQNTFGGRIIGSISLGMCGLVPILFAIKAGQESGIYDQSIAYLLVGLVIVVLVGLCVAWAARRIDVIEAENTELLKATQNLGRNRNATTTTFKLVCLECSREFDDLTLAACPHDGEKLARITGEIAPGSIFAERYEVQSLLGKGASGAIYLAKHLLMGHQVALKVLRQHLDTNSKTVQRFQREAQATARLEHKNILSVRDFGISDDGYAFIVIDYINGCSLAELLADEGPMLWSRGVPLFVQICEGLSHAHESGIIHRDLKPSNVMVSYAPMAGETAKIIDFGIAKSIELEQAHKLTQTGEILGTPAYMSPEQCLGVQLDDRSDVYALGCLMYETVSGNPPFLGGTAMECLRMHIMETPPPLSRQLGVPAWLEELIVQCLEKDPQKRPLSAEALRNSLRAGLSKEVLSRRR